MIAGTLKSFDSVMKMHTPQPCSPVTSIQLFDDELFAFDTKLVPETVKLYKDLRLKHEPLSLIPPEFECPLPPLEVCEGHINITLSSPHLLGGKDISRAVGRYDQLIIIQFVLVWSRSHP